MIKVKVIVLHMVSWKAEGLCLLSVPLCSHGAEEVAAGTSDGRPKQSSFSGSGYRLGDTDGPSPVIHSGASRMGQPRQVMSTKSMFISAASSGKQNPSAE